MAQRYQDFYRRSIDDRAGFWSEQAGLIDWQTPFGQVLHPARRLGQVLAVLRHHAIDVVVFEHHAARDRCRVTKRSEGLGVSATVPEFSERQ